jgi:uroporphyrinogen-III synthase
MKTQVAGTRAIRKVVVTRSRKGNGELAGRLSALGLEPVAIDTIEFLPPDDWSSVDAELSNLAEFDWLLFTSVTGVEHFAKRMRSLSLSLPWHGRPVVATVGEKTAAALRMEGVEVEFVPSVFVTRALAEELPRDRGNKILILRADNGDPEAASILERAGFQVHDLTVYKTSAISAAADDAFGAGLRDADAIVFASPSAVDSFMGQAGLGPTESSMAKGLLAVCIGPVTEGAARRHGFNRVITSKTHTIDGLLMALKAAVEEEER